MSPVSTIYMRTGVRVVVSIVLLAAVGGLCIHYGATYDTNWPHPTADQLDADYDEYVDEQILLIGEVHSTAPTEETLIVEITDNADEVVAQIEVEETTASVEPGGTVQVYGTLQADETLTPTTVAVVDRGPTDKQYKLGISVVGIVFAVGYFLRYWRLNLQALAFEQRSPTSREGTQNG